MNLSFPSFLQTSFRSLQSLEKITLTKQQMTIGIIILAAFSALAAYSLFDKFYFLHRYVNVIEADGSSHRSLIEKVNGKVKVCFDGFFASCAIAEGEFKDGQLNGQAKVFYHFGTIVETEGEFKDGCLNGQGKITYRDGKVEEGEFKNGQLNGQGEITFSDGIIYQGEVTDSIANGPGKVIFPNGTINEGIFNQGELNGRGTVTLNGRTHQADYKNWLKLPVGEFDWKIWRSHSITVL